MADKFNLPEAGEYDGGENQDYCSLFASFINQRQSVERLLNWLRESQTTCTDTNCFDDISGLSGGEHDSMVDNEDSYDEAYLFSLMFLVVVGFVSIYAMNFARDRNRSRSRQMEGKQDKNFDGGDQDRSRRNDDDDHSTPAV